MQRKTVENEAAKLTFVHLSWRAAQSVIPLLKHTHETSKITGELNQVCLNCEITKWCHWPSRTGVEDPCIWKTLLSKGTYIKIMLKN